MKIRAGLILVAILFFITTIEANRPDPLDILRGNIPDSFSSTPKPPKKTRIKRIKRKKRKYVNKKRSNKRRRHKSKRMSYRKEYLGLLEIVILTNTV